IVSNQVKRITTTRFHNYLSIVWLIAIGHVPQIGCSNTTYSSIESVDGVNTHIQRDIDELERVKYSPRACRQTPTAPSAATATKTLASVIGSVSSSDRFFTHRRRKDT